KTATRIPFLGRPPRPSPTGTDVTPTCTRPRSPAASADQNARSVGTGRRPARPSAEPTAGRAISPNGWTHEPPDPRPALRGEGHGRPPTRQASPTDRHEIPTAVTRDRSPRVGLDRAATGVARLSRGRCWPGSACLLRRPLTGRRQEVGDRRDGGGDQ